MVKMQCSQGRHSSLTYSEVASLLSAPALAEHSLKVLSLENPEQLHNLQALLSLVTSSLVQRRISPQLEVCSQALPPLCPRLVAYSPKLKSQVVYSVPDKSSHWPSLASSAYLVCLKIKLGSVPEDVYSQCPNLASPAHGASLKLNQAFSQASSSSSSQLRRAVSPS